MTLWVIYDHPRDCPGHFVVRRHRLDLDHQTVFPAAFGCAFDSLDEARAGLPLDLVCVGRQQHDDPVIVEVWI